LPKRKRNDLSSEREERMFLSEAKNFSKSDGEKSDGAVDALSTNTLTRLLSRGDSESDVIDWATKE